MDSPIVDELWPECTGHIHRTLCAKTVLVAILVLIEDNGAVGTHTNHVEARHNAKIRIGYGKLAQYRNDILFVLDKIEKRLRASIATPVLVTKARRINEQRVLNLPVHERTACYPR